MANGAVRILRAFAFKVGIKVDDSGLDQINDGIARAQQGFAQFAQASTRALIGVGLAVGGLVTGLGTLTAQTARQGREARDLALSLGLTTDQAQELVFAFRTVGSDGNDLSDAFNTLADRANDAAAGTASMVEDFGLVGLSVDDLRDKDPIELFRSFADAVSETSDVSTRNAAIVRTLGDDLGRRLIPLLTRGSAGFDALAREARELGVVLDSETVEASFQFETGMVRLRAVAEGLRNEIGSALIPATNELTESSLRWFRTNRRVIRQRVRQFADGAARAVKGFGEALKVADDVVKRTIGGWGPVFAGVLGAGGLVGLLALLGPFVPAITAIVGGLGAVVGGVLGVSSAVGGFIAVLIGGAVLITIGQLAAAIGGLALAWDDLASFIRGDDSALGRFIDKLEEGGPEAQAFAGYLREAALFLGDLGNQARAVLDYALTDLEAWFIRVTAEARDLLTVLRDLTNAGLGLFGSDIAGVLGSATDALRAQRSGLRRRTAEVDLATSLRRRGLASLGERETAAAQGARLARSVAQSVEATVNVDARGRSNASEIGAEVGWNLTRSLRGALADLAGGTP